MQILHGSHSHIQVWFQGQAPFGCSSEGRLYPDSAPRGGSILCSLWWGVRGSLPWMLPALGEPSSLCPTESCLSCGRRNPAIFHPLFKGGLCQTCRVSAAVLGLSGSLGSEDGAGVQPVLLGQGLAVPGPGRAVFPMGLSLSMFSTSEAPKMCISELSSCTGNGAILCSPPSEHVS